MLTHSQTQGGDIKPLASGTLMVGSEELPFASGCFDNIKAHTLHILNNTIGAGYSKAFDNTELVSGVLTVTHNLGNAHPTVTLYDNAGQVIMPDEITSSSENALTVDLTSYGVLAGDWVVVVK